MNKQLLSHLEKSAQTKKLEKDLLKKVKRVPKQHVDELFHTEHAEVFNQINCLECANCCKTTSPIFTTTDISRLSKLFKLKTGEFIDRYLQVDADNDFVLKSSPCPFLMTDNTCFVYNERPMACREYPHTNRKNMYQILDLTEKNAQICPAVTIILNRIMVKKAF